MTNQQRVFLVKLYSTDIPMSGMEYVDGIEDLIRTGAIWDVPTDLFDEAVAMLSPDYGIDEDDLILGYYE